MSFFNKQKIGKKFFKSYTVIFLDRESMQERFSTKLSRVVVLLWVVTIGILNIGITYCIIAFTPIKEYIPGFVTESKLHIQKIKQLSYKVDSLDNSLSTYEMYVDNIQKIISGDLSKEEIVPTPIDSNQVLPSYEQLLPAEAESAFREMVEKEEKWNYIPEKSSKEMLLFKPVSGIITSKFDPNESHFAVDIACNEGDQVKSVEDGTVIFADFTSSSGHTIIVLHTKEVISVYKHNSQLFKKSGDQVKAGEVIAESGSSGEESSGPHLHFELWINGIPVDPTMYIDFS